MSAPGPRLAAWLLRTFGSGASIDAILGDLTEEYQHGRNRLWFWWQALAAIVVTFFAAEEHDMRQRLWYLLVPTIACAAITAALSSFYLPTRYQADAALIIVPQRVPESWVQPTALAPTDNWLRTLSEQVMSRTRLEEIIEEFDLYAAERKTLPMEEVVEKMRRDIALDAAPEDAFRISFRGEDPRTVLKVTERLAALYIQENLEDRALFAEGTEHFIDAHIEYVRKQIIEKEAELRALRARASGAPLSEADLLPYEVLKETYKGLLQKKQNASMTADLERRQIGEQFKIIDPGRLPERPIGPSRRTVNMAGAGIGLGLGAIALIAQRRRRWSRPQPPPGVDAGTGDRATVGS